MIKHKFVPFAILTLLGLGGLSTQAYAAAKEKTTNTKTTTTAAKKTATTKKADKPAAKNTSKKPTAAAKTSKTTTVKAAAAPKATSSKDDIAWAQGVGAISKFKPDGSKPYYKRFEDCVREVIAPRVPGAALTMVADGQVQVLEGFGTHSVGSTLPVNPDAVFRLASVSKTFA
ncbi:MAG TPA: serine hydrolase domain-containing protein, partial [Cellvibrionaceae bacterium]|nr:serine hydrolase domain-containing protein [Cellvibrionaceae bacterium]